MVCASTGNTSASAAAYAARAGLTCAVLIPEGHIALGKLAQALVHGAQVLQVRGNFDQALDHRPRAGRAGAGDRGQLGQPATGSRARRPAPSRSSTCWATRPTSTASRSATPATSPPTGGATSSTKEAGRSTRLPRMFGFQAAGAAPIVDGPPDRAPRDRGHRHPHRQPGQLVRGHGGGVASRAAPSTAVTDEEILAAYRFLAAEESVFCEAASAASVAGLLKDGRARGLAPWSAC